MWLHSSVRGAGEQQNTLWYQRGLYSSWSESIHKQQARQDLAVSALVQKGSSCAVCRGGVVGETFPISDGGNSQYCSFTKDKKRERKKKAAVSRERAVTQGVYPCSCVTTTRAAWTVCTCKNRARQVRPSLCMLLATFPFLPTRSVSVGLVLLSSFSQVFFLNPV